MLALGLLMANEARAIRTSKTVKLDEISQILAQIEAQEPLGSILDVPQSQTTLAQTGVVYQTHTCDHAQSRNKETIPDFYQIESLFSDPDFKVDDALFWADRGEANGAVSEYADKIEWHRASVEFTEKHSLWGSAGITPMDIR